MEEFSEVDFNKLINDCEILILPEDSTVEEVLSNERNIANSKVNIEVKKEVINIDDEDHKETEEDFKRSYEFSKAKTKSDVIVRFLFIILHQD